MKMGNGAVCEHFGTFRSSELSRFRHSKRKFRRCPLCGFCNQITTGNNCSNVLLLVEYTDPGNFAWLPDLTTEGPPPPCAAGHGRNGAGGHYTGRCLCSPEGCPAPPNSTDPHALSCGGFANPFHLHNMVGPQDQHFALVSEEHIQGFVPGRRFGVGDRVTVRRQDVCVDVNATGDNFQQVGFADREAEAFRMTMGATNAHLWRGGVLGGAAVVRGWRSCGHRSSNKGWFGDKILSQVPWIVEDEEASILLLREDGSTGLDLSFATHIFLLDPIKDPALRNQIVSRAHRMGATGPVQVQLVQVSSDDLGEDE